MEIDLNQKRGKFMGKGMSLSQEFTFGKQTLQVVPLYSQTYLYSSTKSVGPMELCTN